MRATDRRCSTIALVAIAILGCEANGSGGPAAAPDPCGYALGMESALHVSESCGVDGGDGSLASPYKTLADATKAAQAGDTIALAPGAYVGGVELAAGINLVGLLDDHVTISGDGEHVLKISGKGSTEVRGLTVMGTAKRGIVVDQTAISLGGVHVKGVGGTGVHVTGSPTVDLIGSRISASAGVGLIAKGTGKVGIIDPIYLPSPRVADGKVGIIDPIYAPGSSIQGNQGGGVAIIDPIYSPAKTDELSVAHLLVKATDIDANGGFGIALYGAGAIIERSAIRNTIKGAKGPWADGILVAMGKGKAAQTPDIHIDESSLVLDNGRTGVLVMGPSKVLVDGEISGNKFCGAWAGNPMSLFHVRAKATLHGNKMVGLTVSKGADLRVDGATISGTTVMMLKNAKGEVMKVADGIGVYDGARATVKKAHISGNARAAVVIHAAAQKKDADGNGLVDARGNPELDVQIEGCTMTGNKHGIVVNGAPEPPQYVSANTRERGDGKQNGSGGTDVTPAEDPPDDLGVQTEFCTGDNGGDEGCAPAFE